MNRVASARRTPLCAHTDRGHANRKKRQSAVLSGRPPGAPSFLRILEALRLMAAGLLFALGVVALLWLAELAAFG